MSGWVFARGAFHYALEAYPGRLLTLCGFAVPAEAKPSEWCGSLRCTDCAKALAEQEEENVVIDEILEHEALPQATWTCFSQDGTDLPAGTYEIVAGDNPYAIGTVMYRYQATDQRAARLAAADWCREHGYKLV